MKLLLNISYLGTDFCGYQIQKIGRTVQGELNRAAKELFGFDCDITGCSRTDAGVHANMFCAAVTRAGERSIETNIRTDKIAQALNAHLPEDVSVFSVESVKDDFHPRYDVKYKEYIYRIYNRNTRNPFENGRSWHIPHAFEDGAVELMDLAAKEFVGKYDFSAFMASGSKVESTVRDVKYAEVTEKDGVIVFKVAADGFLYNMVRIMTGTLVSVANRKIHPSEIKSIIESHDRNRSGMTAPAEGLYLNKVVY